MSSLPTLSCIPGISSVVATILARLSLEFSSWVVEFFNFIFMFELYYILLFFFILYWIWFSDHLSCLPFHSTLMLVFGGGASLKRLLSLSLFFKFFELFICIFFKFLELFEEVYYCFLLSYMSWVPSRYFSAKNISTEQVHFHVCMRDILYCLLIMFVFFDTWTCGLLILLS